jgi:probable O-glycosylation ligase (exosortase A-associated)
MNTIQTYQQDDSALGRLNAWDLAIRVANDRITGGGFVMWFGEVFRKYSPDPERHHAAHSIYFQALGEQGWIGLILFMGVGVATWGACRSLRQLGETDANLRWAHDLGSMIQVSMVGFATAGAFLSLTWFDLPYNQMIIAAIGLRLAQAQGAAREQTVPAMAPSARPMVHRSDSAHVAAQPSHGVPSAGARETREGPSITHQIKGPR